jgi:serine protease
MILRFPPLRATAVLACALSLLASAAQARRVGDPTPPEGLDTGRLIVKYRSQTGDVPSARSEVAAQVAANRQGVSLSHVKRTASGAHVFKLSRRMGSDEARLMAASIVAGDADVEYAEPDRLLRALRVPNDTMLAQQWSLADSAAGIRAGIAWDTSIGTGVTVAVIDTGVRPHADLVANLLPGYDFISDTFVSGDGNQRDADAYDPGDAVSANYCFRGDPASGSSWHGTHVAGIVAAVGNNATGVAGVAYGAHVLPLRALGKCGGYTSDIADAIVWAAGGSIAGVPANPNPARVINLSLGGGGACDNTTQAAIDRVRALGAVVVVAAGNENSNVSTSSPANCRGVVAVAATGPSGGRASYSNFGTGVTLAAPGGDQGGGILSTLNSGSTTPASDSYASYMGTSMATPVVSGVVALMFAVNPRLTPDNVTSILQNTARAFPASCSQCGAGLVDAAAAVASAAGTVVTPPPPPPPPPGPVSVLEAEPNNTIAKAQSVPSLPAQVTGAVASNTDLDYFKVSIAAGKTLTASLSQGSKAVFGLYAYTTAGKLIASATGSAGLTRQMHIINKGAAPVPIVLRVSRSSGPTGSYGLALSQ